MSSSMLTQSTTWLTRAGRQWWKTSPWGKHILGCWEDGRAGSDDLWPDLRNYPGRCVWGNAREGWSLLALAVPTGFCSDLCYGSCWSISNLSLAIVTQSSLLRLVAGSYACIPRDVCLHLWEPECRRSTQSSKYAGRGLYYSCWLWLVPREVHMKRGRATVILIPHIVASSAFSGWVAFIYFSLLHFNSKSLRSRGFRIINRENEDVNLCWKGPKETKCVLQTDPTVLN